jgi:hypothetical protein
MTRQGDRPEDYEFKIDVGVPIPDRKYEGTPGKHPHLKYPFPFMEIGDSFFVPLGGLSYDRRGALILTAARSYCRYRNLLPISFILRRDRLQEGIRCWRIK